MIKFKTTEAVSLNSLSGAAGLDRQTAERILNQMERDYAAENRGFILRQINDTYQLCTNPQYYEAVRRLIQTPAQKNLTQTLMETLAIIAYQQPVTKAQIEEIRGVSADHAVNRLMEYGLIMEKGRMDAPGKPILFGTSEEFLRYFGFSDLDHLPKPDN